MWKQRSNCGYVAIAGGRRLFCDTFFSSQSSQVNEISPLRAKAMRRERERNIFFDIAWTQAAWGSDAKMWRKPKHKTQETISRLRRRNDLARRTAKGKAEALRPNDGNNGILFWIMNWNVECYRRCCSSSQAIFWCWHVCEPLLVF